LLAKFPNASLVSLTSDLNDCYAGLIIKNCA
jgi:hypothetical protein